MKRTSFNPFPAGWTIEGPGSRPQKKTTGPAARQQAEGNTTPGDGKATIQRHPVSSPQDAKPSQPLPPAPLHPLQAQMLPMRVVELPVSTDPERSPPKDVFLPLQKQAPRVELREQLNQDAPPELDAQLQATRHMDVAAVALRLRAIDVGKRDHMGFLATTVGFDALVEHVKNPTLLTNSQVQALVTFARDQYLMKRYLECQLLIMLFLFRRLRPLQAFMPGSGKHPTIEALMPPCWIEGLNHLRKDFNLVWFYARDSPMRKLVASRFGPLDGSGVPTQTRPAVALQGPGSTHASPVLALPPAPNFATEVFFGQMPELGAAPGLCTPAISIDLARTVWRMQALPLHPYSPLAAVLGQAQYEDMIDASQLLTPDEAQELLQLACEQFEQDTSVSYLLSLLFMACNCAPHGRFLSQKPSLQDLLPEHPIACLEREMELCLRPWRKRITPMSALATLVAQRYPRLPST